jgi:hypothetical protein
MNTIVLDEPLHFRLTQTVEPDSPGPGEALVQVRRLGICGTDYHAFRGRQPFFSYPRILGHELGVEVLALGPELQDIKSPVEVGDKCAVEPYLNCGHCIACRAGKTNCCATLKVLGVHIDGGMRERIVVPVHKLHKSSSLSLDQLALVETLGIGAHAVDRAAIKSGENVLVIGAGPIGLTVIQFATAAGARVFVMDVNVKRLEFCRAILHVAAVLSPGENAAADLEALCDGDLPTAVFDATGNPDSMKGAFKYVASGGKLIYVGLFLGDVSFYDPDFHRKELSLLATRNSTGADFRRIIGLMESGVVDTTPWITHRASFDELIPRFNSWLDPAECVIKAVVTCEAS